ncbi:MAG: CPBP family intramembrane metalloprotease [Firmicutes bacterium]|nr:CPBP family intramembrane metalloprotease [Bacillota bacterium]
MSKERSSAIRIVKSTYLIFISIMVAWFGAWLLKIQLERGLTWLTTSRGSFAFWTVTKLILWIIPALYLLQISQRSVWELFNFANWISWLKWGGGLGLLIALTALVPNYLQGNPLLPAGLSWPLVNVILIAPFFEEFLMRGAILGNLQLRYSFFTANIISSLMFLILHIPGWFFTGVLQQSFRQPIGGALSIFLVSLVFGWATHRSKSLMAGILAHFLNNLF